MNSLCVSGLRFAGIVLLALSTHGQALAAPDASGGKDIYTCVDAHGRKLTADRPIAACLDREQLVLGSSGNVKRIQPPSYNGQERAAIQARQKAQEDQRVQDAARQRSETALLQRYPNAAALMRARLKAAEEVLAPLQEGYKNLDLLRQDQARLSDEAAFYRKNPQDMPAPLRLQLQNNLSNQKSTQIFIEQQRQALVELHMRFDKDAATLAPRWQ